ncbi:DMT family transporter [Angustibacter sp. McL0619]|uniref:DMT family transporter n=1 Tax=Angustibacter sp. McL0619 TaxID=3415676 RepID=UPI003CF4E1DF
MDVSSWVAAAVALAAAVCFGWSTALMHHGASGASPGSRGIALLRHVFTQWKWLIGLAASLFGLALHTVALGLGSLTLVQPIVVTGLFFSLVFRDALDRHWPSRRTLTWGAVTAAGLAVFLAATGSSNGTDLPDDRGAAVLIGLGLIGAAVAWNLAPRRPVRSGLLLGTAGGIVFGLMAGSLKATTGAWAHHELFTSWPLYAAVTIGLTGFLLNQHLYHRSRLADSIPMLNLVNPLVALVFGVVVFDERPRSNPLAVLLECVGLAAVLLGIFFLGRGEGAAQEAPQVPAARSYAGRSLTGSESTPKTTDC